MNLVYIRCACIRWNMMALGEEDWDIVAHKGPKMGVIGSSPYGQGQAPQAIRVMYLIILTRGREATLVWLQLSNSWFHSYTSSSV